MYEYIKGNVAEVTPAYAVIDAAGVGYLLNISLNTFSAIGESSNILLYTHFIVREDAQILYGFYTKFERELFRLLIGVSGVGGNTARMILSTFSPEELQTVIFTGKAETLKIAKGLGIKTAQKIIVELKDKVAAVSGVAPGVVNLSGGQMSPVMDEALSALATLGFAKSQSEKVVREIVSGNNDLNVEAIIRAALKKM